jgi:enoyl-CoA hydratase
MEPLVLTESHGPVRLLTINRPRALNALNVATLQALAAAVADARADSSVRVVVVTGAGAKAFVAGADITELAQLPSADARRYAAVGQSVFDSIERLGKPVIAAVKGFALGGGCELAMACTLRVAADTAMFGQPEINLGLIPGFGGTQRLARLVGCGRAYELLLEGHQISAAEGYRIGLVNRVVRESELLSATLAWAASLAQKPPVATTCILESVIAAYAGQLALGQSLEAGLFGVVSTTDDMREGTAAFLEKRQPRFTGR